jgi:hypothetical protein
MSLEAGSEPMKTHHLSGETECANAVKRQFSTDCSWYVQMLDRQNLVKLQTTRAAIF